MHKPAKNTTPAPLAQKWQEAMQCAQQEPAQNSQDELPNQVPPPNPPAKVPDPIQPHAPPAHVPDLIQPQNSPVHVPNPVLPPAPPVQISNQMQPQLNWSHFKPEFSGKPEEDVGSHLLRTNDWMETQFSRGSHSAKGLFNSY